MSSTDNKIVKLKFDNAQFEREVSTSMSTLDKLKAKLNFEDSAKNIEKLQTSVNNVDFSAMEKSLKFLENRFSATGEFIYKIWDKVTDKAINAFKQVESATLGQIRSGGWSRALNIANAKFQTEGLNASWEAIKKAADYAVTDTAYGLDEAAKAASQLLASGIDYQNVIEKTEDGDLTEMHKSLRAISGVAAMTNSSFTEISHIFTRIAGQGKVMATDLNSIAARGINAAATLAEQLGVTEADIRDLVHDGQIDFLTFAEAMDDAFGEHAKQANETFQGSMSNVRAALSRIGAIFAQPVIDKTNKFFNALTGRIKEVQRYLNDVKLSEDSISPRFATHFAEAWDSAVDAAVNFVNAIDLSWLADVANTMDNIAIKMKRFFDWVNEGFASQAEELELAEESEEKSLKNMIATQDEYKAAMTILFKDASLTGNKRVKWLENQGLNPKRVQKYIDSVVAAGYNVKKASIKVEDSVANVKSEVISLDDEIAKLPKTFQEFDALGTEGQEDFLRTWPQYKKAYRDREAWMQEIVDKEEDAKNTAKAYAAVTKEYNKMLGLPENSTLNDFLTMKDERRTAIFKEFPELREMFYEVRGEADKFAGVTYVFQNLSGSIANIKENLFTIARAAKNAFRNVFNVDTLLPGLIEFTDKLYEMTVALGITESGEAKLQGGFEVLFTVIRGGIGLFGRLLMKLMDVVIWFAKLVKGEDNVNKKAKKTNGVFQSILKIISTTLRSIRDLIMNFGDFLKMVSETEGVKRLRAAFAGLGNKLKKDINPASSALAKFADSYKGIKMEDLAKGIGWIADKIAWLIEKIPVLVKLAGYAFGVIAYFAKQVWGYISGFFDNKDAGSIFETVKSKLVGAWDYTEDIGENIGNFFKKVWDVIKKALSDLDIHTLQDAEKAAALIFFIYELWTLLHNFSRLVGSGADILKSVSKFMNGISGAFSKGADALRFYAIAAVIQAIAKLVLAVVAAIYVLSTIKQERLYDAMGALLLIGLFILAVIKLITKLNSGGGKTKIEKSGNISIKGTLFNGLLSFGLAIAAIGLAIKLIMDSVTNIADMINKYGTGTVVGAFVITGIMLAAILGSMIYLAKLAANLDKQKILIYTKDSKKNKVTNPLWGMAALTIALGLAVSVMASAVALLAEVIHHTDTVSTVQAFGIVAGLILILAGCMVLVMRGLEGMLSAAKTTGRMWAAVALMFVFGLVIAAIIAEVAIIAALPSFLFSEERVIMTLSLIAGTLLSIGLMVALIGYGASKMKGEKDSLLDVALILAVVVAGIAIIVRQMVNLMKVMTGLGIVQTGMAMGLVLGSILLFVGGVAAILAIVTHAMNKKDSKVTSGDIFLIATSLVVIAAAFVVFAKAMQMLSGVKIDSKVLRVLIGLMAIVIALATIGTISDKFGKAFLSIGVGFAAAGLGMLLLGKGLELIGKGLGYFAIGLADLGASIDKHPKILIFMGLLTVALVALASIVKTVIGPLGKGIEGIMSGVGSLASGLMKGLDKILQNIPDLIEQIIEMIKMVGGPIIEAIKDLVKPIWKAVKGVLNKIKTWYDNLPSEAKKKFVRLLAGIFLVAEALAPQIVTSFLRIIFKVLDTIAEHAYVIAMKLVQFIVLVIHALAQAITRNAHVIGNALKAVLYALEALVVEAINVVFGWIPGVASFTKNFQAEASRQIALLTADSKTWIEQMNAQDEQMQASLGSTDDLKTGIAELAAEYGLAKANVDGLTESEKERDAYHDNRMQELYGKKEEDETEDLNLPTGNALENTLEALTENEQEIYDTYLKQQGKAAEEYRKAHLDVISKIEKAEEEDSRYNAVRSTPLARKRANELLSNWVKSKTGLNYDFNTMQAEMRNDLFKKYPELLTEYNKALKEISTYDEVIADTEENLTKYKNQELFEQLEKKYGINENSTKGERNKVLVEYDKLLNPERYATKEKTLELKNQIREDHDNMVSKYNGFWTDMFNGNANVWDEFFDSLEVRDWVKSDIISSNMDRMLTDILKKMRESGASKEQIQKFIKWANDQGYNVGSNALDGAIKGMTAEEKLSKLETVTKGAGSRLINAFRRSLDERSPSHIMEESGEYAILGVINGLMNQASALESTTAEIGNAMIVSFGAPFDTIAQMASGKLDYDPSIRPVLDSSSIASGVYGLNSMFQGNTVALDGYTGRLAADITGVSNQNEEIVDQLMQLRADMNDMTETILGMQIVLDSGTVVGELSGGMDYSLGVSSIRKKRGI